MYSLSAEANALWGNRQGMLLRSGRRCCQLCFDPLGTEHIYDALDSLSALAVLILDNGYGYKGLRSTFKTSPLVGK
jgi:hypothetical protein